MEYPLESEPLSKIAEYLSSVEIDEKRYQAVKKIILDWANLTSVGMLGPIIISNIRDALGYGSCQNTQLLVGTTKLIAAVIVRMWQEGLIDGYAIGGYGIGGHIFIQKLTRA